MEDIFAAILSPVVARRDRRRARRRSRLPLRLAVLELGVYAVKARCACGGASTGYRHDHPTWWELGRHDPRWDPAVELGFHLARTHLAARHPRRLLSGRYRIVHEL